MLENTGPAPGKRRPIRVRRTEWQSTSPLIIVMQLPIMSHLQEVTMLQVAAEKCPRCSPLYSCIAQYGQKLALPYESKSHLDVMLLVDGTAEDYTPLLHVSSISLPFTVNSTLCPYPSIQFFFFPAFSTFFSAPSSPSSNSSTA